jgi:putative protease
MEESNQDFLGLVLDYKDGIATIEQRNFFKLGDEVQFFGPNVKTTNWTVDNIMDEDGNPLDVARHPQMIVKIKLPFEVSKDDMMRVKVFDEPEDNK